MAGARKVLLLVLSHRFHRWRRFFLRGSFLVPQISQIFTDSYGISGESLSPPTGGICIDWTGRLRENPWVIVAAGNLRINSVSSDEKYPMKKSVYICEICGTKKLRWKNLWKSVKSVGLKNSDEKNLWKSVKSVGLKKLRWKICENLWICGTKKLRWKNLWKSVKSVGLKNSDEKICENLWNLWD